MEAPSTSGILKTQGYTSADNFTIITIAIPSRQDSKPVFGPLSEPPHVIALSPVRPLTSPTSSGSDTSQAGTEKHQPKRRRSRSVSFNDERLEAVQKFDDSMRKAKEVDFVEGICQVYRV